MFLVWLIPCLALVLLLIVLFFSIFKVDFRRKRVTFNRRSITAIYIRGQIGDISAAFGRREHKQQSNSNNSMEKQSHQRGHVSNDTGHHSNTGSGVHHHSGGSIGGGHSHGGGDFGGGHFGGHH